jgi:hypothetical protein
MIVGPSMTLTKESDQGIVACVKHNQPILPCDWVLMECMTSEQLPLCEGALSE